MSEWHDGLKVGDEVIVDGGGISARARLCRVGKITKTQIVVGGTRFNRQNGRVIGGDRWYPSRLNPVTDERKAEIRRLDAIQILRSYLWNSVPDAALFEILAVIQRSKACNGQAADLGTDTSRDGVDGIERGHPKH